MTNSTISLSDLRSHLMNVIYQPMYKGVDDKGDYNKEFVFSAYYSIDNTSL